MCLGVKHKLIALLCCCLFMFTGCTYDAGKGKPYEDLLHESKVFGHQKSYRLYLPSGYSNAVDTARRYPVIYFFHGWGGRYFMDDNAKLEYARIKTLVDKYQVILVMWDGNIEGAEPNPYNIGNREDVKYRVQMKDYFPELVAHIDSSCRTLADRDHRGIIGFSMGGFMSLFLAGEDPGKVCATVSLAGSPELFIGYPTQMTLYPIRYSFKNLQDVDTRMHNGDTDILHYLNEEVRAGALWEGKKIDYWTFRGGHRIDLPGETKVFDTAMRFVTEAFKKDHPAPKAWSHYDLYPDFKVWGYEVESDKKEPGFLFLKNVTKEGFGLYTHRWLPSGPALADLRCKVTTGPVYTPGRIYEFVKYAVDSDKYTSGQVRSDAKGQITMELDGGGYEVGITDASAKEDHGTSPGIPGYAVIGYEIDAGTGLVPHTRDGSYLHKGRNKLSIRLFRRDGGTAEGGSVRISLSTTDSAVHIMDSSQTVKTLPGARQLTSGWEIDCSRTAPPHGEPAEIKFILRTEASSFKDDLDIPVWYEAPLFDSIRVDDGIKVRDSIFGKGNANGLADAGENILLYQGSHRLRLYTEDRWVLKKQERLADESLPAIWPDGVTFSSVIRIDPRCPDGYPIEFLGSYETKTFNPIERKLHWGRFRVVVHKKG